jgi:heme-degrading monooxygenase HmoA
MEIPVAIRSSDHMIARLWRGQATVDKADAYVRHATQTVFPALKEIAGHRGAYLLRRETEQGVEFLALTLWDSLEAVRGFAGSHVETAIVAPEARAVLTEFNDVAKHYEVVASADLSSPPSV